MTLGRCGTALVTPFRSDGSVDEETLTKLVEWQIDSGIHFLVACGTTAETPTLSHGEYAAGDRHRERNRSGPSAGSGRIRHAIGIAIQDKSPRIATLCYVVRKHLQAMTRAKRVIMRYLAAHPIAFVERCTQGFAETPISLVPVCPGQAKLSMKSGLAEVNIVHLHGGHGGGPWRPQRGGSTRQEK